jgi:hypothetical protein
MMHLNQCNIGQVVWFKVKTDTDPALVKDIEYDNVWVSEGAGVVGHITGFLSIVNFGVTPPTRNLYVKVLGCDSAEYIVECKDLRMLTR